MNKLLQMKIPHVLTLKNNCVHVIKAFVDVVEIHSFVSPTSSRQKPSLLTKGTRSRSRSVCLVKKSRSKSVEKVLTKDQKQSFFDTMEAFLKKHFINFVHVTNTIKNDQETSDIDKVLLKTPIGTLCTFNLEKTSQKKMMMELLQVFDFIKESPKKLMKHQKLAVKEFTQQNPSVYLLAWKMGSGKTLGALSMVSCKKKILIVCSNTMIGHWLKEIKRPFECNEQTINQDFTIVGYTEFRKQKDFIKTFDVVIVDEAHQYRNLTESMKEDVNMITQAKQLLLLTGTPLQNDLSEVNGMLQLLGLKGTESLEEAFSLLHEQKSIFFYDPFQSLKNVSAFYPETTIVTEKIAMDPIQTLEYILSLKKDTDLGTVVMSTARQNSYDSLTRAISNSVDAVTKTDSDYISPKMKKLMENIDNDAFKKPHCVYSHYKDRGVEKLFASMTKKKSNLRLQIITGSTNARDRDDIIKNYNQNKIDVFFITDAAREGIDLQGTGTLHILEPHVNLQTEGQTKARVVRHNSHQHSENKHVHIIKYISTFPDLDSCKENEALLRNYLKSMYKIDTKNICKALKKHVKAQHNETVDEKYERQNVSKHKQIEPWLIMFEKVGKRKL